MRVLITGCNGLVGCRLAKTLLQTGHTVFGLSLNGLTNPYIPYTNYYRADICDAQAMGKIMDDCLPDVLVHAAAITKPDLCEANPQACVAVNRDAVKTVFAETERRGIYGIHLSTDFVFAGTHAEHTEDSIDFPAPNVYGRSKREAEEYLLLRHPQVAIVRTALVYGYEPLLPRSNIFTWAVDSLRKNIPIRVVDDQWRTPTFADDLTNGLLALCERCLSGVYHLAGTDFLNVYDFVCHTANVFGLDASLIKQVPTQILKEPARRPPTTRLRIDKAKRDLGYMPNSLEQNLAFLKVRLPN